MVTATNDAARTPQERLGLAVIPAAGWTATDIQDVAREAEAAGFDAIFTTEVNNDAMATAQLMGTATQHIQVGTWIANIYLRHSYVCAQGAALIAEATGGRFILGLGVSHQPVNGALDIDMSNAPEDIRRYTTEVCTWLRGEGPATHLPQHAAPARVPVYVAAVTSRTVETAAAGPADGIMPIFWSVPRVRQSKVWIDRGRATAPQSGPLDLTLGIPTFIGDDMDALRDAARQNLMLYTFFPLFQHLFRASGFAAEADRMERGDGAAAYSDELLDAICLIGPADRCRERLAEYRAAGVDMPILMPPLGVAGARDVIAALAPNAVPA
ncbi:MAG TPA: LLM class flavin-dependent oxidoreductase [Chloroflexota bacterium]|jgi:alkanesulfonate monooxygenase SsuD/methylene tetrahydromethanopterin reductase-like flavin-dependent oxidoreductase (luciferase family)